MLWDEEYEHDFTRENKRRVQRACDVCRRRKSAGNGSQNPGNKCSTCIDAKLDCTYLQATTKRTTKSYIEYLEARLEHVEALVRQLRAELATAHFDLGALRGSLPMGPSEISSGDANNTSTERAWADADRMPPDARKASLHILRTALRMLTAPPQPHADDLMQMEIAKKFESISVGAIPKRHFIGNSSGAVLVKAAIDLKADVRRGERRADGASNGNGNTNNPNPSAYFIQPPARNSAGAGSEWGRLSGGEDSYWEQEGQREGRRPGVEVVVRAATYWTFKPVIRMLTPQWENTAPRTHKYFFPPPELAMHLIELYFAHVNVYMPLLHRPTFQRGVDGGLHL
ncbi:hypothetical protein B0H13DRAFT_2287818, partial [Mycena leptocephala]